MILALQMFLRPRCSQALTPLRWGLPKYSAEMPLKAKILGSALSSPTANLSTTPSLVNKPLSDDTDDVIFGKHYGVRTIELNRPQKLNSLNGSMTRKIFSRLKEWEKSQLANAIIIGGTSPQAYGPKKPLPKAFCAGGDVAAVVIQNSSGAEGLELSKSFFGLEYQLDHLIATYSKPFIAYMDGYTMGGGVGLCVHAPVRIATENTIFAMPETSIGFFPDVGGSFFLPRLEGQIGTYLALTSNQLNGVNTFYTGIATHYIHSSNLLNLTGRLAELEFKDYDSLQSRLSIINATIEEFGTGIPHDQRMVIAGELRRAIDRCFKYNRIEEILEALESEKEGKVAEWASQTQHTLLERSPTSLKVALKQMRLGKDWDISETFQREYHMAARFMARPDFASGVSARLIHKPATKPEWDPPTLDQVKEDEVDQFFRVEGEDRLYLSENGAWKEYPFHLALPTERDVERVVGVETEKGSPAQKAKVRVLKAMIRDSRGKLGVKEKVEEILERCCVVGKRKELRWGSEDLSV